MAVSIDYMPIGYDKIEASQNHRGVDAVAFASMIPKRLNTFLRKLSTVVAVFGATT